MEASEFSAGAASGGLSGGESGWTTYIGSPLCSKTYNHEDKNDEKDFGDGDTHGNGKDRDDEDEDAAESDDSMTSDAASGPSQGKEQMKNVKDGHKKVNSGKRTSKEVKKKIYGAKVEVQDEEEEGADWSLKAESVWSHV